MDRVLLLKYMTKLQFDIRNIPTGQVRTGFHFHHMMKMFHKI